MENEIFEQMPVRKAYMKMALPVVLSMVISLVYNMVDTYFIAKTGNTDLVAGVSLGAPIFTLMIALGDILGLGGSSVISRLFGKKQDEDGKRISVFCFYGALVMGIFVAVILMVLRVPILQLLGADQNTMPHATQYYTYIALGAPFIIVSFTPSNQLRTEGFAQEAMFGTILGSVVNMILDPLFIFGLNMGAGGAAIATVIGNIFADGFFLFILLTKSKKLSVSPKEFSITGSEILQILAIGIPASITNLMQSIGIALTNRFLLPYGNDRIAAMGIVMKINLITVLVLVGFAFGAQPLIGYNYGANNRKRLKEVLRFVFLFEGALALFMAVVLSVLARPLIGLFMNDPDIVGIGAPMLRFLQIGMIFTSVVLVATATFQSAGKALGALILSASRQGVLYALVLVIASGAAGYTGIIASQPIADFLTAVIAVLLYKKLLFTKEA